MNEAEKSIHEGTSEIGISNEAWKMAADQRDRVMTAFQIEMTRRNNVALRAFATSSDRWSRRLFWLTLELALFTAVLIILTVALLLRGG